MVGHRDLLLNFLVRDLKSRYAGSLMGIVWNVIHPLAMIIIYTMVFSRVMGAKLPGMSDVYGYSIYLCAGLLPWNAFVEVISRSTTVFLDQAWLLKKMSFPKKLLGGSIAFSSFVNFLIGFSIFLVFLVLTGHRLRVAYLALPVLLILQFTFAFGLGLILSALNVFLRDISQLVGIGLQVWFWLTPVVYLESILPEGARGFFQLNPMYHFIRGYHSVILDGAFPSWSTLGIAAMLSLISLTIGSAIFFRLKDEIVDEV
ncbi:ABC transporter permease [Patescibacteria group bacterium]|nr:MAG: ABC transporter permease [Patescibacteria group bacterium]